MTVTLKDRRPQAEPEPLSAESPPESSDAEASARERGRRRKRRALRQTGASEGQSKGRRERRGDAVTADERPSATADASAQPADPPKKDRKTRRAERKQARREAPQEDGDEKKRRAERKQARKQAASAGGDERERRRKRGTQGGLLDEEDDPQSSRPERDSAEEAELGSADPDADLAGADEPADEEAAPAERSGGKPRKRELTSPMATTLWAKDGVLAERLFDPLRGAFAAAGLELAPAAGKADFALNLAPPPDGEMPIRGKLVTVLTGASDARSDAALARTAKEQRALFVPVAPLVRRYGEARMLEQGELSGEGVSILAVTIRDGVILSKTGVVPRAPSAVAPPEDFTQALALAEKPAEMLRAFNWPGKAAPRLLRPPMDAQTIEQLAEGNIRLSAEQIVPLQFPIDWQSAPPDRRAQYALYGLDFVCSALTYWFAKANRVKSERLMPIDAALKQRNVTASALLARAGEVMVDCLAQGERLPDAAWHLGVLQRRARAFTMFLLCCRMAAMHRIKFDEAVSGRVFRGLVESLDRMRPQAAAAMGAASGVAQAAFLAALALPLRKIAFGKLLLDETMESLCACQLGIGLAADGVWQEGFAQHCAVLDTLRNLSADLRGAEVSPRVLSAPILALAKFANVFLTDDGMAPAIAELAPSSYAKMRRTTRAIVQGATATANRIKAEPGALKDAALFRESGFFVSRSPKVEGKPNSHLVVQARPASAGGISLSFAFGPVPLLVGGGTMERKAPADVRRASRLEPASHNTLRINGKNYAHASKSHPQAIRIDSVWEEKHWAAVRVANEAFPEAAIARTVIHLKPVHALLVVDELMQAEAAVRFEQFWHLASHLKPLEEARSPLAFTAGEGGVLNVAFDADAGAELIVGGRDHIGWTATPKREVTPNPYLRREADDGRTNLASFFRVAAAPLRHDLAVEPAATGWVATVAGEGLKVRFAFADGQLKLSA